MINFFFLGGRLSHGYTIRRARIARLSESIALRVLLRRLQLSGNSLVRVERVILNPGYGGGGNEPTMTA